MANYPEHFDRQYQSHLKHLKLKGLQPKTIDAYARGMRRIGEYFSYQVDALSEDQLSDYFTQLLASHSWSGVKLDLYGLKFFTVHVLRKPWMMPNFSFTRASVCNPAAMPGPRKALPEVRFALSKLALKT